MYFCTTYFHYRIGIGHSVCLSVKHYSTYFHSKLHYCVYFKILYISRLILSLSLNLLSFSFIYFYICYLSYKGYSMIITILLNCLSIIFLYRVVFDLRTITVAVLLTLCNKCTMLKSIARAEYIMKINMSLSA